MTIYDPTALRRELHEMPELALHEKRTSAYVAEKLKALGIETHENVGGSTGVVGIIRGTEPGPVFMLRADMDALPFVIDGKPCCIHACGHDGHTAMLLAAASRLKDKIKRGTLKLLFQPAEETLQGRPSLLRPASLTTWITRWAPIFARFKMSRPACSAQQFGIPLQPLSTLSLKGAVLTHPVRISASMPLMRRAP